MTGKGGGADGRRLVAEPTDVPVSHLAPRFRFVSAAADLLVPFLLGCSFAKGEPFPLLGLCSVQAPSVRVPRLRCSPSPPERVLPYPSTVGSWLGASAPKEHESCWEKTFCFYL